MHTKSAPKVHIFIKDMDFILFQLYSIAENFLVLVLATNTNTVVCIVILRSKIFGQMSFVCIYIWMSLVKISLQPKWIKKKNIKY